MPEREFRSIKGHQVSAVDLVTVEVRRSILHGVLAPGERFSVAELARRLDISHIPVREALRRLEGQGLIVLNHGRSAVVVPLSVEDLRGIYALRQLIEPELAARSVGRHTDADIAELAALIASFEDEDPDAAWLAHQRFHLQLVRPAASAWDLRALDQLWAAAERYTRFVYDFAEIARTERVRRERIHMAVLDAVRERDADRTRRALADHLAHNEDELIERIGKLDASRTGSAGRDSA